MIEHGSFTMQVTHQTLIIKSLGAWNYETSVRFCDEYKKLASTICDKPWACLVDLTEWELGTPEIWSKVDDLNEWSDCHNQKYEVVVCSMKIQQTLLRDAQKVYTNLETKYCETQEQAIEWLKELSVYK